MKHAGVILVVVLACWTAASCEGLAESPAANLRPDQPNEIRFNPIDAKFVRLVIVASNGAPCIDELEVYGEDEKENLSLAAKGSKVTASSCLLGNDSHKIEHLNDGKYGNANSWIPMGDSGEWAQIELLLPARITKVIFSRDREGKYKDRMPQAVDICCSMDAHRWKTVASLGGAANAKPTGMAVLTLPSQAVLPAGKTTTEEELLNYAFSREACSFYNVNQSEPLARVLEQAGSMLERLAAKGLDVSLERAQFDNLRKRQATLTLDADPLDAQQVFYDARLAKRRLMLRDPDLACLQNILFVQRHPYNPSHNYSDFLDGQFREGGGVCNLTIPRIDGRLEPGQAKLSVLFDGSKGVARDPALNFEANRIYFAYRPKITDTPRVQGLVGYWHLYAMNVDGTGLTLLTDGPFHDYYPCVLPDGDLVCVSTRCRQRFLCWVPMSVVLFRMHPDGSEIRPLSYANLSEWGPSVMRDGRILWTRSEYQDKGSDYGHTLWAVHPDGTYVELVYGNNTDYNLMNGREVPDSTEICATLISHFGDFNGPIALIEPGRGRYNPQAATVITPDHTATSSGGNFRDPVPISHDYVLVSHRPSTQFGIYVIDRWGNRELLSIDPAIGGMTPQPLGVRPRPPVIASTLTSDPNMPGRLAVSDVYEGMGPSVKRGSVKYLRVVQELRSELEKLPDGKLKERYDDFQNYYAGYSGPNTYPIWPTYVAKGVLGIAPVEEDGSAYFEVPSGKTLYFQALDANFTEVQRMRSVMQMQPGEIRSCTGCHENRLSTGASRGLSIALRHPASKLQPPPWGAGPFGYEKVVQPVFNARCVSCHNSETPNKINLSGTLDKNRVPASYDSLVRGQWINYFDMTWHLKDRKAEPLTFGTVKSKLFPVMENKAHENVKLTADEMHAIKCWIDLNAPLWPDYINRNQRPARTEATN